MLLGAYMLGAALSAFGALMHADNPAVVRAWAIPALGTAMAATAGHVLMTLQLDLGTDGWIWVMDTAPFIVLFTIVLLLDRKDRQHKKRS